MASRLLPLLPLEALPAALVPRASRVLVLLYAPRADSELIAGLPRCRLTQEVSEPEASPCAAVRDRQARLP